MKIAVIGAGSWGTAIAHLLAGKGNDVWLWARREKVARGINEQHRNPDYLATETLDERVHASTSREQVVQGAEAVVIVVPSRLVRDTARALAPLVGQEVPIVVCTKGVEADTGLVPAQVFAEELGVPERLAALSGPNHAEEVVRGVASATVIASSSPETARFFQELFATTVFRTYTSEDVVGVELCAAFKNIIAIAVGVSYGVGYGDNTAAMLMTRGIAEMSRLVVKAGGRSETCMGLAGTGDLIVTCISHHSRNRRLGEMIANGKTFDDFTNETHMVAEGAVACRTIGTLAERYGVELPITDVVRGMVWEGLSPQSVETILLSRSLKAEFYS